MIGFSHWGMFEISLEEAMALAEGVIDGRFVLWLSDDSGWLQPEDYNEANDFAARGEHMPGVTR